MKLSFWLAECFLRRKRSKGMDDGRMMTDKDGQMMEPAYAISSSMSLKAQLS